MELYWIDHVIFIIVGIIVPLQSVLGAQMDLKELRFTTALKIKLYWSNNAWMWFMTLVIAGAWWFNDRNWELLGLTNGIVWPEKGVSLYVFWGFIILYLADTISEVGNQAKRTEAKEQMSQEMSFLPSTGREYLHYMGLAFTAGICEEIIFRGYFIRYFQCFLGDIDPSFTLALLLPALIFGLVHFYQGWQPVVKITAMAVMFGYVFIYTESLWLLIIFHVMVDLIGGAIAWYLLARKQD